jgi:hypothetical protein
METLATLAPQIAVALAIVGAAIFLSREQRKPMDRVEAKLEALDGKLDSVVVALERHCANGHGGGAGRPSLTSVAPMD